MNACVGPSTSGSSSPQPGQGRGELPDFGLFATLQPVAPALHGRGELLEVHFQGVQDVVGVVLGTEANLTLAGARLLDDLLRLALGLLHDLLLGDQAHLLVARLLQDPLRLALCLGEHLLALLHDPARLLDLLGDRRAHLIEDVVDLLLVDAHLIRQRHGLGVVNRVVELVDQYEDIHGRTSVRQRLRASSNRTATGWGPNSLRSPPNMASSFTPLELKKLYCGDANM